MANRVSAAEARKMLEQAGKATPGPWTRASHGTWEVEAPPNQLVADCGTVDRADADAAFIASARDAVPALAETVIALEAERDAATQHTIALEQANIALLRWQSVASEAHVDHLCAIVRSLAVSDETPRTLRDLSAMGVEEELRRVIAAERINRAKSEETARTLRADLERMEAERDEALAERDRLRADREPQPNGET